MGVDEQTIARFVTKRLKLKQISYKPRVRVTIEIQRGDWVYSEETRQLKRLKGRLGIITPQDVKLAFDLADEVKQRLNIDIYDQITLLLRVCDKKCFKGHNKRAFEEMRELHR